MLLGARKIELNTGTHSYFDSGGDAPALLLLHSFSFREGAYPLLEELSPNLRVVVPELPFTGREPFALPHRLDNYVHFLLEFVRALGLEQPSIFGNSVGGTLGLMCCQRASNSFDRLIVRSPLYTRIQPPGWLQSRTLNKLQWLLSGNRFLAYRLLEIFYSQGAKGSPLKEEQGKRPLPYRAGEIDPVVVSRFLGHLVQVEIAEQLHEVANKTLILWGEHDSFVVPSWGEKLQQLLPDAQIRLMPGEYHNIATVDLSRLAEEVVGFIDQTD